MKVTILQAGHGDSILISFNDSLGKVRNILTDGGPPSAYESKTKKGGRESGSLKRLIDKLREAGERIDLLVLSHVDEDHIGGLLSWFQNDDAAHEMIDTIWFNSGRYISEYFLEPEKQDRLLQFYPTTSAYTSIAQGVIFEDYITRKGIWTGDLIMAHTVHDFFGARITVLSPNLTRLKALEEKWSSETDDGFTGPRQKDYGKSLGELIDADVFCQDASIPNGSSIAFLFETAEARVLCLADAHPQPIIDSLKTLGYSQETPLAVDLVKIAHHGSKGNTSRELLDLIACKRFVISTNGSRHALPNKQCLARIISSVPDAELYFNYPDLIDEIFLDDDLCTYSSLKLSGLPDPFLFN